MMSHPLTAKDLSLYAIDYARLRQRQTNGSVSPDELRGVYGLGDFLVLMTQAHGEEDKEPRVSVTAGAGQ